ncbi:competence protein ComJ [Ventosimonas gracilis]|uniref:Ribosomal RNA large subunit methyltransferase J n=1 Tax=Ventosimonas gracilis TaxID=1680762 RepID=A0A139SYE9_9GAMM|nr:23S rRNA (adenine(2030)-N(6))-methyltransferase RlmJ [Ventosimonas gracilis]KXU39420.1 competence protein ComJ [Ventosimonas gracilis]
MHSYRHGFHAANHADVLKHAIFIQILDYAIRKPAPITVIDTHSGAGLYDLTHEWARQNVEADSGINRLLCAQADTTNSDEIPPLITRYLQVLAGCRKQHGEQAYPGSPWLALHALREDDRLHLFETHPSEIEALRHLPKLRPELRARHIKLHALDGFSAAKAMLPPVSRRGIVMMDPSYEDKQDYRRAVQALSEGLQRFASGCYLLWYPLLQRREVNEMLRSLYRLPAANWLHAWLQIKQAPENGLGLYGSGVFVINPPWTLRSELQAALPWLQQQLAQDEHARSECVCSA